MTDPFRPISQKRCILGVTSFYIRDSSIFRKELLLSKKYPDLKWRWIHDKPVLLGVYHFTGSHKEISLSQDFNLRIEFPENYPENLPIVYELDCQIPSDYHMNPGKQLCLGVAADIAIIFHKKPDLQTFIEKILNPYLYRWIYLQKYGTAPWGERPHGIAGIYEFYSDFFHTKSVSVIISLLSLAIMQNDRANFVCPCGSGEKVKSCHRKSIHKLYTAVPVTTLVDNYRLLQKEEEKK
jgi:hypothetical protein